MLKDAETEAQHAARSQENAEQALQRAKLALEKATENAVFRRQERQAANEEAARAAEALRMAERQALQDEADRRYAERTLKREQNRHASVLREISQQEQTLVELEKTFFDPIKTSETTQDVLNKIRNKIFISYRRNDSEAIVGRIYDRLEDKFGLENVAIDIDVIPPGADFIKHIKGIIDESYIVLVVIGSDWVGRRPDGTMRIADETDPVRFEVEIALRAGIAILPVLVDGARMPASLGLPPDLQPIITLNAINLDIGKDFNYHIQRVISAIENIKRRTV